MGASSLLTRLEIAPFAQAPPSAVAESNVPRLSLSLWQTPVSVNTAPRVPCFCNRSSTDLGMGSRICGTHRKIKMQGSLFEKQEKVPLKVLNIKYFPLFPELSFNLSQSMVPGPASCGSLSEMQILRPCPSCLGMRPPGNSDTQESLRTGAVGQGFLFLSF